MSNLLATLGHYLGPIWHWTLGQLVTGTTVIAGALGNSAERPVLIYTVVFIALGIYIPKGVKKVIRR